MLGRQKELNYLERLYKSTKFEFLILYGRRRVGKSTLLYEFSSKHRYIFLTGQEQNNSLNQNDFINKCKIFNNIKDKYYYIFVKSGYTDSVYKEAMKHNVKLLTINDLFINK